MDSCSTLADTIKWGMQSVKINKRNVRYITSMVVLREKCRKGTLNLDLLHSLLYSSVHSLICYLAERAARALEIQFLIGIKLFQKLNLSQGDQRHSASILDHLKGIQLARARLQWDGGGHKTPDFAAVFQGSISQLFLALVLHIITLQCSVAFTLMQHRFMILSSFTGLEWPNKAILAEGSQLLIIRNLKLSRGFKINWF